MALGQLRFTNALGGTADFIYPGPTIDMQSPTSAGAVDGTTYVYYAQSFDMSQWEIGSGAYTLSSGTFARTTVSDNSLGTTAKINFANPPQVFVFDTSASLAASLDAAITALGYLKSANLDAAVSALGYIKSSAVRPKLSSNLTYYVRTDGNDSNNGLTNSAGGAFLTIQKAVNTIVMLDLAGFNVTVQVGAGTYNAGFTATVPFVGGNVTITGDTTTPGNVIIQPPSAQNCFYSANPAVAIHIQGFKMLTSGGGIGAYATDGSTLYIDGKVEFGACSTHIGLARGGVMQIANGVSYTISGNANYHINMSGQSRLIANLGAVTATGTPAFSSAFAQVTTGCFVQQNGTTFSGAATGTRCLVSSAGGIDTGGAFTNATYGLGNANGTVTSPGYLI